jgi:hypothetical protein
LKQDEFKVLDWSKFRRDVVSGRDPYTKYTLIPDPNSFGGYKPQLTIYDRFGMTARIQFSAPKILYDGNNFDEITEGEFEKLIFKVSSLLGTMALSVTASQLRKTEVSKIDYSKNIIFTDHTTSSMILNELNKIDISAKLDETTKDFKNKGQRLSFHANTYEICFYDKRKELEQTKKYGAKRTDENGLTQIELLDRMTYDPFEVFRIEYRLNEKRKMRQIFSKYGVDTDLKFESVFKKDISKKLLLEIWRLFENKFDYTLHNTDDPMAMLEGVFRAKPKISLLKALAYSEAFRIASSDKGGIRRFRECVEQYSDIRSWYRIKGQLKGVGLSPIKTKLETLLLIS